LRCWAPWHRRHTLVRVTTEAMGWESDAWPNGVVGTPDGKKLYVNKWAGDNKGGTWVFNIKRDGTLSNMRKFSDRSRRSSDCHQDECAR
jgi:gluconolactonase